MPNNNNNRNNPLGHNINFNDAPEVQSGLGGYFTGNAARNEFSNKFWDDQNGYLATVTKELDNMLKQYRELAKYSDQMTKSERQAVRARQAALREEAKVLKNIKDQQDVSAEAASGVIKEATNLLTNSQAGLAKGWNVLQDKTDKALENVEKASNHYTKLKDDFTKMNKEMGNLVDTANKASESFASSLSTTLKNAGDRLANLSNMFSLNKIANNTAEQNARSIEKIQSDTMKQFGFSSNSQFYNFADSLNNNIKEMNSSMGWLFNNQDLKNYLGNLSQFGVSDVNMAQQQMKNSVLATKYLGVSNETQTMIFKYMKRTNNTELLEKHNQTIVGLLKSELGVSKEQLDALSQIAYGSAEDKSAIGMTNPAIEAQESAMLEVSAILSDMFSPSTAEEFEKAINDIILNPGDSKWIKALGSDYFSVYNGLYEDETKEGQAQAMMNTIKALQNSDLVNMQGNSFANGLAQGIANSVGNSETNIASSIKNMALNFDWNKFNRLYNNTSEHVKNTTNDDVYNTVKKSTEATILERIQNKLSEFFGIKGWKAYPWLATLAFTAYLATDTINMFKGLSTFIGGWKTGGGLKAGLQALMGGASGNSTLMASGMKSLLKGGIVVGLTGATIAGLAAATNSVIKAGQSETSFKNAILTDEERKEKGWLASGWSDFKSGLGTTGGLVQAAWGGLVFGNKSALAKGQFAMNMSRYSEFRDEHLGDLYRLAVLMLSDSGGILKYLGVNENHDALVSKYNKLSDSDKQLVRNYAKQIQADKLGCISDYEGNVVSLNSIDWANYHKAGKDYIPRDNYKALLHKGEMVLNAQEAEHYRQMFPHGGDSDSKPRARGRIVTGLPWTMTAGYPSYPSGGQHRGLDFGISVGTKVGAAMGGKVVKAYTGDNYNTYKEGRRVFGQYVLIKGNNGLYYRYGHLSKVGVKAGQQVSAGDTIGLSGNTGYSTGPHLHFQVQKSTANNSDISPYNYVTSSLFQAKGDINMGNDTKSSNDTISSGQSTIPIRTTKFIPKAFQSATDGGVGGMEESVSRGVNNGIDRLIGYLDGIRSEQNDQRRILEAFSKSRLSESTY